MRPTLPRRADGAPCLLLLAVLALACTTAVPVRAAPPTGFVVQPIGGTWNELAGVTFLEDGRSIAWERGGRVWMINADGTKSATPMIDLSQEVGAWRDHGLLGLALHPNFMNNGRMYLLYVVDRHHLLNFGTPQYNPNTNAYFAASIGRITRYTATAASNFTQVDPASRTILLGESLSTGIPVVHQSHGVGSLLFGDDGTLLVSVGDNASYESNDFGGQVSGGYVTQALADGILAAKENVGAFRAQLVDTHCGKILRIDPETGDGLPSNPFYDPAAPRAPRSRVWCLGLRNPFRMEFVPDSGSHLPSAGNPGTLVIGDVGWNGREEVNIATTGGQNFGWPVFEGLDWMNAYATSTVGNPDAPNPLFGALSGPVCTAANVPFINLIRDDSPSVPGPAVNPCSLYQAESATASGPLFVNDVPGFTGTGYLDYQNPSNDYIEWRPTIATTGSYTLHFRYALGAAGNRPLRITVDGNEVAAALDFPSTGSWSLNGWSTVTVNLNAGLRRIRATAIGQSGANLDGLAVVPAGGSPTALPATMPTFVHRRPAIDWVHWAAQAHVPGFDGNVPTALLVGSPASGVTGEPFQGFCAIGGSRVEIGGWPQVWHGVHLFGDFASQFIRGVRFDAAGKVTEVKVFDPLAGPVVLARYNPYEDSLWVVRWGNQLVRIKYAPDTNLAPVIIAAPSSSYGPSPLPVTFDASASFDPEGTSLVFTWTFPDNSPPVQGAIVQHVFSGSGPARHDVLLTVRDAAGVESSTIVPVWTDNTPPSVELTSVHDGDLYSMQGETILPLEAAISDAEHATLDCAWTTVLHHNTHTHAEPVDPACSTVTLISPLGCGEETFFFSVSLTVTDPLGLSTTKSATILPDCKGRLLCPSDLNNDQQVNGADLALVLGAWAQSGAGIPADLNHDGTVNGADLAIVLGQWGPCP